MPETAEQLRSILQEGVEFDDDDCWPVMVIGTPRRGASIGLVTEEGTIMAEVATGPRSPLTALQFARMKGRRPGHGTPGSLLERHPAPVRAALGLIAAGLSSGLTYLLLTELGDTAEMLIVGVTFAGILGYGTSLWPGQVSLGRSGLVLTGRFFDLIVPQSEVSFHEVDRDGMVLVRLEDPDELIGLTPSAILRRRHASVDLAVARFEAWLTEPARHGQTRRRPSIPLVMTTLSVVCVVAVYLAATT